MRLVLAVALVLSATSSFASEFQKNDEGNDVKVVSKAVSVMTPASTKLLKKNLTCSLAKDRGGRPMAIVQLNNVSEIARISSPSMNTTAEQLFAYSSDCSEIKKALKNLKALSLEQVVTIEKATHIVPEGVPAEGTYCKIRNVETVTLKLAGRTVADLTGYVSTDIMDWTKGSCDQF